MGRRLMRINWAMQRVAETWSRDCGIACRFTSEMLTARREDNDVLLYLLLYLKTERILDDIPE